MNPSLVELAKACVFGIQFKEHSVIICWMEGIDLRCLGSEGRM